MGIIILLLVDLASLLIPQYTGEVIDGLTKGSFGFEGVKPLLIRIFLAGLTMMLGRFGWRISRMTCWRSARLSVSQSSPPSTRL